MSKSRRKGHSEVESLRGEIRRLNAQLKYCKRCNEQHRDDDLDYDDVPEIEPVCQQCGKNKLKIIDLKYVVFEVCELCGFKKKIGP
jgi:NAD-dependent SIR2 family protein deacetylase